MNHLLSFYHFFQGHPLWWIFSIGLLGLSIGSFLNVVIYRLPIILNRAWQEESTKLVAESPFNLSTPRSQCPHCHSFISVMDNIPLISYALLKGQCRNCQVSISKRYPIIEGLTAILSMVIAAHFGITLHTCIGLLLTWVLIAASGIDYDEMLLPDQLTLSLMWIGLISSILPTSWLTPSQAIIGTILGYMTLWSVYWGFKWITKKDGMGYGDFKLAAALGACLGWQALPMMLLIASSLGAIVGITQILLKKHQRGDPIPFGPFLAIAGWIGFVWQPHL